MIDWSEIDYFYDDDENDNHVREYLDALEDG
jgi:hypothetical protein